MACPEVVFRECGRRWADIHCASKWSEAFCRTISEDTRQRDGRGTISRKGIVVFDGLEIVTYHKTVDRSPDPPSIIGNRDILSARTLLLGA